MTTPLHELGGVPIVDRLGWTLIHFVWQTLGVAKILGIMRRAFSANTRSLGLSVVLLIVAAPTSSNAQQIDDKPTPIATLAKKILANPVLREWKLQHVDKEPTVHVNEFRGHRIVIRKDWPVYNDPPTQQARPEIPTGFISDDWEIVLVPIDPKKPPVELKTQIKWADSKCPYHTADICLGEGYGYMWFTRAMLVFQHAVRKDMKLTGGDDPIAVLADGLLVEDKGSSTRNSVPFALSEYGDKALPYIETAIKKSLDDPWWAVTTLKTIQSERATELLLKLFHSGDDKLRHPAMYALIHTPYREKAKQAYFEILREGRYPERILAACLQFGWHDAMPIFRENELNPKTVRDYQYFVLGRRALAGNPIPQALLDAEQTMRTLTFPGRNAERDAKIAAARKLLIESPDHEAANIIAVLLAIATSKGNVDPIRNAGLDILHARHKQSTIDFLEMLSERLPEREQQEVAKLRSLVIAGNVQKTNDDADSNIAWGAAVDGLQAGLSFGRVPFVWDKDRVPLGEQLSLEMVVKNVSDKTVDFQTVAPSFSVLKVTDSAGKKMFIAAPQYDGPAIFQSHKLKPGQSLDMPMQAFTISPRAPMYNWNGYHIHAGMGKYKLTASIDLTPMVDSVKPKLLHTAAIQCEIIKPNKERITERFAAELKKRVDEFNCKVVYLGPEKPPLRSAGLVNPKFNVAFPDYWSIAKIDRQAANAIIDFLASEDLLFRYVTDPNIPAEFPQTTYFLNAPVGKGRLGMLTIPLTWSKMQPQLEKLRDAVGGEGAKAVQKILDQPLFAQWHHLTAGSHIGVSAERQLYKRDGDSHFYVRFRITNRTKHDAFVDLSRNSIFFPNQWGFHRQNYRIIVDETRMIPEQLTGVQRQRIVVDAKAGKLTRIPYGKSVDYFREFNRGGRDDVQTQQDFGKFMIISIDGQLRVSDGKTAENVNLQWNGQETDTVDTDVVIAKPIDFQPIPEGALVIEGL